MFKNKGVKTTKKPSMVEPKVVNPLVHIVDVDMAITRSKLIEKQVFKTKSQSRRNLLFTRKKS
jgi:hypothetical protein